MMKRNTEIFMDRDHKDETGKENLRRLKATWVDGDSPGRGFLVGRDPQGDRRDRKR